LGFIIHRHIPQQIAYGLPLIGDGAQNAREFGQGMNIGICSWIFHIAAHSLSTL
jgi:hypothetical protein